MDEKELQEFDLDALMHEFLDEPQPEEPVTRTTGRMPDLTAAPNQSAPADPEEEMADIDLTELDALLAEDAPEAPDQSGLPEGESLQDSSTIRFDLSENDADPDAKDAKAVSEDTTIRMDELSQMTTDDLSTLIGEAVEKEAEKAPQEPVIMYNPRTRLRELKKKLVAGPEKRYYELSEMGVGKLQAAILVNVIIVGLCTLTTTLFLIIRL